MKKIFFYLLMLSMFVSCQNKTLDTDLTKYVDPLIGTGGHGHTYPGATSPFGMVQLSPDSRLDGWDGCSGYHYSDSVIYGFSHTHLSGTGVSDYGDILLMPVIGDDVFDNKDYASSFSHSNEVAEAGFYSVLLDKYSIKTELTTTPRCGMHRYTFPQSNSSKLVLDLNHRDFVINSCLEKVDDYTVKGCRVSRAWAKEQHQYFYIQFSEKIEALSIKSSNRVLDSNKIESNNIVACISFGELSKKELLVKVGLSVVDMGGAEKNLKEEIPHFDFDKIKSENKNRWQKELSKIVIEDDNEERKTIFYTSLYHNLIVPNIFSDVDGRYRGMDMEIHKSEKNHYTIFSLWDTYRATHPLYTIIDTVRTNEFIHTFKNQFNDGGILPIWELSANYTGCMIGYHSIPVIVDAYLKGITDIDGEELLKMLLVSANADHLGLEAYKKNGYISISDDAESVSKTLEYAFDDWCIAQLACELGKDSIYKVFTERAQSYKNILDPSNLFMKPKLNQKWKQPFDPTEVDFNYTEANSWQYSFYVPHDVFTLIDLMGGERKFEQKLDEMFNASSETKGRHQSDITGLIGQYAHGNEPSHHMAYLYNYSNNADKTQHYIQRIMNELYSCKPDGLCGNEDCGQMSAWYVFSGMGFYPVNPANGEYVFGKLFFDKVTINLENGNNFTIIKKGNSDDNALVKEIQLNGKKYTKAYLSHEDIMKGGSLTFLMSDNKVIEFDSVDMPNSQINEFEILSLPSIRSGERVFRDSVVVTLEAERGSDIYYTLNHEKEKMYIEPFVISEISKLSFRAEKDSLVSKTVVSEFYKIPEGRTISIKNFDAKSSTPWHHQYGAGGNEALIDGLKGKKNFRMGAWQGYMWNDFEAVVDLGSIQKVSSVDMNCIQDYMSWIWMPSYVEFYGSTDSVNFVKLGKVNTTTSKFDSSIKIENFKVKIKPKMYKYIKIYAKNKNLCPKGHLGEGGKGFIFMDEISVN